MDGQDQLYGRMMASNGVLSDDLLRQVANKIYQEGIVDSPSDGMLQQAPVQEYDPSNIMPTNFSKTEMPENVATIIEPDFYFLQQLESTLQEVSTQNQSSLPVSPFDLSGDQCLLAPILPKILPPKVADNVIAMAGKPVDRMKMVESFMHEMQVRTPFATPPISDSDIYFLQNLNPGVSSNYYFIENQSIQKPEKDWSAYRMFHPETVRRDFPALQQFVHGKPLIWLDNAATTQKPSAVINAIKEFYERDNSNIHRGAHTLAARATDAYEEAREKIRQFIGAGSKDEIIYVRGTTEGINLIANTFGRQRVGPGDEIILSELEHHANIVPWQMLAQETGARLRVIPINERGDLMLSEYERLFNQRTKLVAISQVSNAIGTVVPVHEIIATAHRRGVPVVVDGAQSVQHMPVNVQEMDADFFVFSGHKLFAPTGIGVVYSKMEHLQRMPPWQGGGNMIDRVTFEETTYNTAPAKFEAGTPSIADAIGLGAAIDYVQKIGMINIHRYEAELMEYMVAALSDIPGLRMIGNPTHRAGALSFVMKNIPTNQMGQLLDQEGIAVRSGHHCAQPALRHFGYDSSVRPSLAFYNIPADIDRLREAILKIS